MTVIEELTEVPPDLAEWQMLIGGLLMGPGTPYTWRARAGFEDMPPVRTQDEPRPWAHGVWTAPDWADGRTYTLTYKVRAATPELYDAALDAAQQRFVPGAVHNMWVNLPRKGLVRSQVKPRRHDVPTDVTYDLRWVTDVGLQLFAADPIRYGPGTAATTGFRQDAGGLAFPLFSDGVADVGYLDFGEPGNMGELTLSNAGNAEFWPVLSVAGPTPAEGFEIVDVPSGRRLRYTQAVPAGSTLVVDEATGSVMLDGVADRSRYLTVRQWTAVEAGGSTTLAFLPLGPWTAGTLTAVWASAWW